MTSSPFSPIFPRLAPTSTAESSVAPLRYRWVYCQRVTATDIESETGARRRNRSRLVLAGFLCLMGVLHFLVPGPFERLIPRWLGSPRFWVLSSGVAELASGSLLFTPRTRRTGAWFAAATMVAVFPGNISMAVEAGVPHDLASWAAWLRLPLQIPLIRWALKHTR